MVVISDHQTSVVMSHTIPLATPVTGAYLTRNTFISLTVFGWSHGAIK